MSFYTALTGLNGSQADISATSNNIANVATTGYKRSKAEFGDIFATSPLQKATCVVGKGTALKQVSQEFSQGNIELSGNTLDLAVTGEGFFPLQSTDGQDLYTRNGSFLLDDKNRVSNSAGQLLMVAKVDSLGKADFDSSLQALQIQTETVGQAVATSEIDLAINFPADAQVATIVDENGVELPSIGEKIEIGKGRVIKEGKKVALINFGARLKECLITGESLSKKGINISLIDARFCKPLDENLMWQIANDHEIVISIEEGSIGGFGSHLGQFLNEKNLLDNNLKFRSMFLPDRFIDHDKPETMYKFAGLDSLNIETKILDTLNSKVIVKKSN